MTLGMERIAGEQESSPVGTQGSRINPSVCWAMGWTVFDARPDSVRFILNTKRMFAHRQT